MEIILREDVQHLGKAGEVVKVKDGYARNYLLPKGLAYTATEANKKRIAYEADRLAKQRRATFSASSRSSVCTWTSAASTSPSRSARSASSAWASRSTPTSGPRS